MNDLSKRVEQTMYRRKMYRAKIGSAAADLKRCSKWCAFALKLTHTGKFTGEITNAWNEARHCYQNGIENFKPKKMKVIETIVRPLGLLSNGQLLTIVLMENEVDEITCRVGLSWPSDPSQDVTVKRVIEYGGKFQMPETIAFFPHHADIIQRQWKQH